MIEGADFLTDIATVEAWACLLLSFYYFNNSRRKISFMLDGQVAKALASVEYSRLR